MIEGWPLYYGKELTLGNLDSPIGICTLWTPREQVAERLDKDRFAVCGNLYSLWGINFILRNILANPRIRYLVIWGADRSGSGEALANFFHQGIGDDYRVVNARARIDPHIPREAIEVLRRSVELRDLRGERGLEHLAATIASLDQRHPFGEPAVFPESVASARVLPSEGTGFKVAEPIVAEAWLRALKLVTNFGKIKPTEYAVEQKEILNLTVVISAEDPDALRLPPWLPLTLNDLEAYYPLMLSPERGETTSVLGEDEFGGVSYSYGERLRAYGESGMDQIAAMVRRLSRTPHSRRAMAITWEPAKDEPSFYPPCLTQVLASIQESTLSLTAHFRSHDIFGAWPQNAYALLQLQKQIAMEVGVALGPLTVVSHSAHIYADKWPVVEELLQKRYPKTLAWKDDPRGNFHISIQEGKLVAEHGTTEEGGTGLRFQGRTARQVYLAIVNGQMVSLPEHAAYLGSELKKAELAIRLGLPYTQDKELDLKPLRKEIRQR